MPTYEYLCGACKKKFSVVQGISENERSKPKCPKCKSTRVKQQISLFTAKTSKKS